MRPYLITGASGLLGGNLLLELERAVPVVGTFRRHQICAPSTRAVGLDLTDARDVDRLVAEVSPAVVVHCVAMTDVDLCEREPAAARALNVDATRHLARVTRQRGARFVFISTDAVFDGAGGPYIESDATHPVSVYGTTKLAGERAVLEECPDGLVLRVNFFGWSPVPGRGLAEWALTELRAGRPVTGFTDVRFAPVLANDIAELITGALRAGLVGVYHVASPGGLTKFEFIRQLADTFELTSAVVLPGSIEATPFTAKRPKDTRLEATRLEQAIGRSLPSVGDGLARLRELEDLGYPPRLRRLVGFA